MKKHCCSTGFSPPSPSVASPTSASPLVAKKLHCSACFSPLPIALPMHSITRENLRNHSIHPKFMFKVSTVHCKRIFFNRVICTCFLIITAFMLVFSILKQR